MTYTGGEFPLPAQRGLQFGHFGLASWGIAAQRIGERQRRPIIPAQPSGLGNRRGQAKALKARSISIPGIRLVEFGPSPWLQKPVLFLETPLNGVLARFGMSILRSMISEIAQRRWRLGLFFGALDLGRCPRLVWAGPLARAFRHPHFGLSFSLVTFAAVCRSKE